jgi:hypothetical protein
LLALDPAGFLQIYCATRTHLAFLKIQLILPEVGAVCGVSCCHLCFCIIYRYPDNEISSCRPNVAEVSSLKRDALCNVCWLYELYVRYVYRILVLCTMCSLFVPYTFVYHTARSFYRMLVFCTVYLLCVPYCSFSVPYVHFMYRMLVLCTILLVLCTKCSLCVPYCSFLEPYACSAYHTLVLCTVCSFYVPHARS